MSDYTSVVLTEAQELFLKKVMVIYDLEKWVASHKRIIDYRYPSRIREILKRGRYYKTKCTGNIHSKDYISDVEALNRVAKKYREQKSKIVQLFFDKGYVY